MSDFFLNRRAAVKLMNDRGFPITVATLAKYASTGGGPYMHKFGRRVLYLPGDLLDWAESKLTAPRSSTSDEDNSRGQGGRS